MRKFESIVMSESEPIMKMGTLWIKPERVVIGDPDSKESMKESVSLWYYGNNGWTSILDFDTNYNISILPFDTPSEESVIPDKYQASMYNGITDIILKTYLYNGNRSIGDNSNLVTEQGLKNHIEELNSKIQQLQTTIEEMTATIAILQTEVDFLKGN